MILQLTSLKKGSDDSAGHFSFKTYFGIYLKLLASACLGLENNLMLHVIALVVNYELLERVGTKNLFFWLFVLPD